MNIPKPCGSRVYCEESDPLTEKIDEYNLQYAIYRELMDMKDTLEVIETPTEESNSMDAKVYWSLIMIFHLMGWALGAVFCNAPVS